MGESLSLGSSTDGHGEVLQNTTPDSGSSSHHWGPLLASPGGAVENRVWGQCSLGLLHLLGKDQRAGSPVWLLENTFLSEALDIYVGLMALIAIGG